MEPCTIIVSAHHYEWQPFNYGECQLKFLDRRGQGFTGKTEEWLEEHKSVNGFKSVSTGQVILINYYGEIAARSGS